MSAQPDTPEIDAAALYSVSALPEDVLVPRLLRRLRDEGPECLSQLAIELVTSNKRLLQVLERLETEGLATRRPHRDDSCRYEEGEERWGSAVALRKLKPRR